MSNMKNKEIVVPTIVMVAICLVVTLALSGTNLLTKNKIAEISKADQDNSMKEVLSADSYNEKTAAKDGTEYTYYEAEQSGEKIGYIFVTSKKGYGGDDKVMTAITTDGTIKAVKVLDVSNETPGLGQNTGNKDWYSQFSGMAKGDIQVVKNGASKENGTVNAVTGATISSKAVTDAVNTAYGYFTDLTKAGGN